MEILIGVVAVVVVAWFWRARQYDKETKLDFDVWLGKYELAASPLTQSRMAVAFLTQALHFATEVGAINARESKTIWQTLKAQPATTTMVMWLGSSLPAVRRAAGKEQIENTPARAVGMLMLLAWMSPANEAENSVRAFLFRR